eukprot:EG_transcript_35594
MQMLVRRLRFRGCISCSRPLLPFSQGSVTVVARLAKVRRPARCSLSPLVSACVHLFLDLCSVCFSTFLNTLQYHLRHACTTSLTQPALALPDAWRNLLRCNERPA